MGLTPIAYQHNVSVVSVVAVVAHPVQVFLHFSLVFVFLLLYHELLALVPVGIDICAAVRAAVSVAQPPQQAIPAKVVTTLQLATVADLVEADRALVLLQLPQLL